MSPRAHRPIAEDHPDDYEVCLANLPATLQSPTYIGQAPRHRENFEMIRRVTGKDGRAVLVAVGVTPDRLGKYRVVSSYVLTPEVVERKRLAGHLPPARRL